MGRIMRVSFVILMLTLAVSLLVSRSAFAYDFSLVAIGPQHVVQGHDLYIQLESAVTSGTRDYALYYVDGLPSGAVASWPTIETTCCGGNRAWEPGIIVLKISVPSTVPVGKYALTLRVESAGVVHQVPHEMVVDPVPGPLPMQPVTSVPAIPSLALWESNMVTKGANLCNQANIIAQSTWEGNIWYYDGIRVYYQIADYTGQSSWNTCAGYVKDVYRTYVLSSNGAIGGWRVFPHGLYQDFLRNNDPDSKTAALALAFNSPYAAQGGGVKSGHSDDDGLERETAYLVGASRIAGKLGKPHPLYSRTVDYLLGMVDQMFISKTESYLKPFMAGLLLEGLIQYYEDTSDPRVPPAVKAVVDGLWERAWVAQDRSFYYDSSVSPVAGAPDLNLLIAPAYAWMYKMTGDPVYQQRGDLIFQGGVEGAWLDQGKQFSQNYRWSFDYVKWRQHPDNMLRGDVSGNGKLTVYDAALVMKYSVGLITLTPEMTQLADITLDGKVMPDDAQTIAKYAIGLLP